MKNIIFLLILVACNTSSLASVNRTLEADSIFSADHSKTYTMPSASGTLMNGNSAISAGTNLKISYDAKGLVTSGTTAAITDLSDTLITSPTAGDHFMWNGTQWINSPLTPISAGSGVEFFYVDTASDIGGYDTLSTTPSSASEIIETQAVTSGTSPALISTPYATSSAGIGGTQIDAGLWDFSIYGSVNSTTGGTNCTIQIDVYKRTSGGTETLLFSVNTPSLTTTVTLYEINSVQPAFSINATDRIVIRNRATNTSATSRTVSFYHNGTTHYSHVHTPLVTRHNDLAVIQGGNSTERYHLTLSQYNAVSTIGTQVQEIPTGTIDGSNTTFTLVFTPISNALVSLHLDGLLLLQGIGLDYTISGSTITMITVPQLGQVLYAIYSH